MANILLVDDDIAVVDALRAMLKSSGHNVTTAENGRVGLTKLAEGQFDLVITDILMPDMEGIELIRELKRANPEIPILAISGGGRQRIGDFLNVAKKFGATTTLEKPIRPDELLSAVDTCLSRSGI